MTRLALAAALAAVFCGGSHPPLANATADDPKAPNYFPVATGSRWEYKTTFEEKGTKTPDALANVTTIKEVVKVEAKDGKTVATFESVLDFGPGAGLNKEKSREDVVIEAAGVSSVRGGSPKPQPPLPMLKYPVKAGVIFTETTKDGDVELTTTVTVKDAVEVSVPAGKFKAVPVETTVGGKTEKVTTTAWYAEGVGVVRQAYVADKLTITLELKKYIPGK
jgi:hypothetical protein